MGELEWLQRPTRLLLFSRSFALTLTLITTVTILLFPEHLCVK